MGTETELKLLLDARQIERLRRHRLLKSLKVGRARTQHQISVYFDTPDFRLRDSSTAIRVRHIGQRRIQTVKSAGSSIGGVWVRGEWEHEVVGDRPELAVLAKADCPAIFSEPGLGASLVPIFTTDIHRTIYRLQSGEWQVEMALDRGEVKAGSAEAPIAEVELELISGEPRILFDLAQRLHESVPGRLVSSSKADRGYRLAANQSLSARKSKNVRLDPGMTAARAFQAIARSAIDQILSNHDCLVESIDPEAIHQMRVGQRRLRSAMAMFKPILGTPEALALKEEMGWLQGYLAPARDVDVFLSTMLEPLAESFADEPGFQGLRDGFAQERTERFEALAAALSEPRFTALLLSLGAWLEGGDWLHPAEEDRQALLDQPIGPLARAILERRDRRARRKLRHLATLPAETRHLARIEIKKFRYAAEFFASLFDAETADDYSTALADIQDTLGTLNDIVVSRALLLEHAGQDPARLWAAGMIVGWHSARVESLLRLAGRQVKRYRRQGRFWND